MRLSLPLMNHPSLLVLLSRVGSAPSASFLFPSPPPPLFFFTPLRRALLSKDDGGCLRRKHNVLRSPSVAFNFPTQRLLSLWNKPARERRAAASRGIYRPAFLTRHLL